MSKLNLKLKKGTKIYDKWYGSGEVIKVWKTRIHILLYGQHPDIWSYDIPHVNKFIKLR